MAGRTDLEQLVYVLSADVTQLTKQTERALAIVKDGAGKTQGHLDSYPLNWDRFFGDPAKAANMAFGRVRLGVLEEGGAKIPLFGSSLEHLGVAGIAAGAGVLVAAEAMERASKAAEFAEGIDKTAKKLGLTTDALQELDFVALKTGVSQEVLREGIQKVDQAVGAFTSNVRDGRVKEVFDALNKVAGGGFTKVDVRQWQGPLDGLEKIADAIAKIKDRSQQLALLKDLKVPDDMVPLLLEGGDGIRRMSEEAHSLGLVMDHDMVERGADFAEQLKVTTAVISHDLMRAFIDLAPVIQSILGLMSKMAEFAADTLENLGGIRVDAKGNISNGPDTATESSDHLQRDVDASQKLIDADAAAKKRVAASGHDFNILGIRGHINTAAWADKIAADQSDRATKTNTEKQHELDVRQDAEQDRREAEVHTVTGLVAPKTPKPKKVKQEHDDTSLLTGADEALDQSKKALAEELARQTTDIQEKATAEKAANFADLQKQTDDLVQKEIAIDKAIAETKDKKKLAALRAAEATIEEAAVQDGLLRAAKDERVQREALVGLIRQAAEREAQEAQLRQEGFSRQEALYKAQADLAVTAQERNRLEKKALQTAQQAETDQAESNVKAAVSAIGAATTNHDAKAVGAAQAQLRGALDAQAALPQMHELQTRQADNQNLSPWDAWTKEGRAATADVATSIQANAVKALDSFNSAIANSIVEGKGMRAAFGQIFKGMETDALSYLAKQAEIGLFGGGKNADGTSAGAGLLGSLLSNIHIPGFATGTNNAPGGAALVGENGPEVVNLPKGSQVVPNNMLANLTRMPAVQSAGQTVVHQYFDLHAEGALMADDYAAKLQAQADASARYHAGIAQRNAIKTAANGAPARMHSYQLLGT